ncbi:hypothetical protein DSM104299_01970 [Baekduia alba]|uniref:DUF6636 domain-containing protein n=1 Tax=Baekduia alba TaxID=2997333 RepID=UPI00233FE2E8|nr:DUF6636 domain-containing protein [Baekduia alba]WCB93261.1 hypothetical protein DSM104299_01970 [Baekduia alba]
MLARRLVPIVAAIAATAALAAGAPAASALSGLDPFTTPSGHIACMYQHLPGERPGLRCDVDDVARAAPRPKSCDLDYGSSFGLSQTGRARRLCVGDTVRDPKAKALAYGKTKHYGPFTCTSRTTELRCTTKAGHGFELSRTRQRLF